MTPSSSKGQFADLQQQHLFSQTEICEPLTSESVEQGENIFTDNIVVTFEGKCFQFSGMLEFGRREEAVLVVEKLGGYTPSGSSFPSSVNYLVIGDLEKRASRRNGYGSMINKAMNLSKKALSQIQIIPERDFVKAVVKAIYRDDIRETSLTKTEPNYGSLLERASKANKSRSSSSFLTR
jgi:NAD-dependent DNA ligase